MSSYEVSLKSNTDTKRAWFSTNRSHTLPHLSRGGNEVALRKAIVYDSSELTLKDFVSRHSKSFPLQFVIKKGFLGDSVSINEGDVYTAYFEKTTEVIAVRDWKGDEYSIPVNSATHLGLIYDPNRSLDEALIGYDFETAGDVIKAVVRPTLLRATLSHRDAKASRSVERDELLLVKQCVQTRLKNFMEVYSITQGVTKKLRPSCNGRFTTNPHKVAMYAGDLLKYIQNVSGVQALMISDSKSVLYSSLPQQFTTEPATLLRHVTETSLIAKSSQEPVQAYRLVEIPCALDIKVQVANPDSGRSPPHAGETSQVIEAYKFRRVRTIDKSAKQRAFREAVREGFEDSGVSLQMPPTEATYIAIDDTCRTRPRSVMSDNQYEDKKHSEARPLTIVGVPDEYVTVTGTGHFSAVSEASSQSSIVSEAPQQGNHSESEIASLTCKEILDLLHKMNLSQYIPIFEKESVNGKLLLLCDDSILENDLKVTSKLHRIRLMQLIEGKISVKEACAVVQSPKV